MGRLKDLTEKVFPNKENQPINYSRTPYPVPRNDGKVSKTALENIRPSMMLDHGNA